MQMIPGEYRVQQGSIDFVPGRARIAVTVRHTGDRPVQVGSHMHFYEINRAIAFDRNHAWGMRLDIPAGTAVRFEPGEEKTVALVALGGARRVHGLNRLAEGQLDDPAVLATKHKVLSDWQALGTTKEGD
jgi:urease beta subunit